jgi:acyl-CoA dehydrogenase
VDFALNSEHESLRSMLRSFYQSEAPTSVIAELDREERFPTQLYARMAELGLCGMTFSEEYGGSDADELSICIAMEETARAAGCLIYAWGPSVSFCARGIDRYGTHQQKLAILPGVAEGRVRLAMGLSEPDVGSDLTHLSTRAEARGEDFIVRGQKIFTTGADTADFIFTLVRTSPDQRPSQAMSILLIPRETEGVTVRPLRKLSGQATHTCEVFFDDVCVPSENVVGEIGNGLTIVLSLLDAERIYVAAQGCGIGQGALDMAVRYAHERHQFGQPIIEFQAIGHQLVDSVVEIEMARLLTWRAAWKLQQGLPCSMDASMAKIAATEASSRAVNRGMQTLGGYSYIVDYGMERYYRETKLNEIAGGSNQIMRNIVLKHLRG